MGFLINKNTGCFLLLFLLSLGAFAQTDEGSEKKVSAGEINTAFGIPLFSEQALWSESAKDVVSRLKLEKESDTGGQSRYRIFNPGNVLGVTCTSIILSNQDDKPDNILIMFVNKGDSLGMEPKDKKALKEWEKEASRLGRKIRDDADAVEKKFTELFGEKKSGKFGQGRETTERVKIWTWNEHAFLLAENKDESLSLRVVTLETAKNKGAAEDTGTSSEVKKELKDRVLRRDNGDVVITGIPMVDQGGKGYCVPSTWTRCLQYMGIPADEYTLANAAGTVKGGGTNLLEMMKAVEDIIRKNGRKIDHVRTSTSMSMIKKYIDSGTPLMWGMFAMPELYHRRGQPDRMKGMSVEEYKNTLDEKRRLAKKVKPDPEQGHMCMIIGYNEQTNEIAISDSWGPRCAEEWAVIEEVEEMSQKEFYIVKP